jgi:hypothetical protein
MQFDTEEEVKKNPILKMDNTFFILQRALDIIYNSNISYKKQKMIEQQMIILQNIQLTFKKKYEKICNIDKEYSFFQFLESLDMIFRNEDNVERYLKELFDTSYSKQYDEMTVKMELHNQLVDFYNELKSTAIAMKFLE